MHLFSENALLGYIDHLRAGGVAATTDGALDLLLMSTVMLGHRVYVHVGDTAETELVVVDEATIEQFVNDPRTLERLLQRVHRVTREFRSPPVSLPLAWRKYQVGNRIAFFALPQSLNDFSARWIAEHREKSVVFWELTSSEYEVSLAEYIPDVARLRGVLDAWKGGVEAAQKKLTPSDGMAQLRPSVDLHVVGASAVSRQRPFTQWMMDVLTDQQQKVLDFDLPQTLKVRGSAGTGKTLVLQLKALRELYRAPEDVRVLYLTHGWALADMVEQSIQMIDDRGFSGTLDVWPLMLLREVLQGDLPEGVQIIGDDGLEGKKAQFDLIRSILRDIYQTDWQTYVDGVSDFIKEGVAGEVEDAPRRLGWMLMREFTEVMDAHRLKPGPDTLERYLEIPRAAWMVELPKRGDKEFFYGVFRRFVTRLVEEGQMTTDQAFDDLRRYLETYAWNIRRTTDGYDLILVDEFHLFSDTERYLLHLLTRDVSKPPRLILALDPRQSPLMMLTGLGEGSLTRSGPNATPPVAVKAVELNTTHRFSKAIHRLVSLIQELHPAILDEGDDWKFTIGDASTMSGIPPEVLTGTAPADAARLAIANARKVGDSVERDQRCALVAAGVQEFEEICRVLGEKSSDFTIVTSRDDVERLNYVRRSIVLVASADCAGLQFSHVTVLAFGDRERGHGLGASARRVAITELYLAVSRAEESLCVVTTRGEGVISELIERAVVKQAVTRRGTE